MILVALKMLTGDRARYAAIIIGLTAASLLVTQQLAIFLGYMTRTWSFIDDCSPPSDPAHAANIWVMNPQMEFTEDAKRMSDEELYRVRGTEGIDWAAPLYKSQLTVRLQGGRETACSIVGLEDATLIGGPVEMVEGRLADLRQADAVIVDEKQMSTKLALTGADGHKVPLKVGDTIEINDHRAVIVGTCRITKAFFWQPVIYTTYSRALGIAPQQRRMLTYVLAKSKPGVDPAVVCQRIRERTGQAAYTTSGFRTLTATYVVRQTGIAVNFGIAVLLGFIIGTVIAGQTFYQFTHSNLRMFGMLKAMGTSDRTLLRMVLVQAFTAGIIGYGLGIGGAAIFGKLVGASDLAFYLPWQLLLVSAGVVLIACTAPALMSMRAIRRLEPAMVFRGA